MKIKVQPEVCKAWRQHLWEHGDTELVEYGRSQFLVKPMECPRCETTKAVWVNRRTGHRMKAPYHYPKGYLYKGVKNPQAQREKDRLELLESELPKSQRRAA